MRTRAFRRHQLRKAKRRAWYLWVHIWQVDREPTDHWIGVMASTHCKPCSCLGCGNPRSVEGPTRQERRDTLPDWSPADLRSPDYRDKPRRKSVAKRLRAKAMSTAALADKAVRQEKIWKELKRALKSG